MKEDLIKSLILEFQNSPLLEVQQRRLETPLNTGKILTIIGPRRAGKTAYCFGLIRKLLESGRSAEQILYINFEDERLDRTTQELDLIVQVYQREYPDHDLSSCVFVFDEIQNVPNWDRFVRRMYDTVCKNLIITGSNSKVLSKDIATSLRGRTLTYEILPLSFREYLSFLKVSSVPKTGKDAALVQLHLENYLVYGGFPEIVGFENSLKIKTLQEYFEVMMYRDVGDRAGIGDSGLLRFFLKKSFASATKVYSVNKMFNDLKTAGYKIGKNTLYEIANLCKDAYLFFTVPKFTRKIATQELGDKKLFAIDQGLLVALGLVMPDEKGKLMEQAVFLELYRRARGNVHFDANGYECDFLLGEWDQIRAAVQVTVSLEDADVKKRELRGLLSACEKFGLSEGLIITYSEKDKLVTRGVSITVLPLWEWLLISDDR